MPQATDEDRAWAQQKFGSIDTAPIIEFLKSEGFTGTRDHAWRKEGVTWNQLTEDQQRAICFLIDEWDFGGLEVSQ